SDEEVSGGAEPAPPELAQEADMAEMEPEAMHQDERPGTPSGFACPDCGGALWRLEDGHPFRFRCPVGHAWTPGGFLATRAEALETALWSARGGREEQAALSRQLLARAEGKGHRLAAEIYQTRLSETESQAEVIRRVLLERKPDAPDAIPPPEG